MRDSRDRRGTKRRLLAELLIAAFAILLFGAALMLYERSSRKREGAGDSGSWDEKADELADQEIQLALNERVYAYTDRLEAYLLIGTDNSSENPEAKQGYNGDLADFLVLSWSIPIPADTASYRLTAIRSRTYQSWMRTEKRPGQRWNRSAPRTGTGRTKKIAASIQYIQSQSSSGAFRSMDTTV